MHELEEPFQYVPWELSDVDLEKELEDVKAIAELERVMTGSFEDEEKENEVSICELFLSQLSHLLCGAEHLLPPHKHRRI